MTTLSTSAGTAAYDWHGSGDPVVLLPGAGHDHHDSDAVRELIPGRFRTISIDGPGRGQPPDGPVPSTELQKITAELQKITAPAVPVSGQHDPVLPRRDGGRTNHPQNGTPAAKEQQQ
jgi:hypothetical protein